MGETCNNAFPTPPAGGVLGSEEPLMRRVFSVNRPLVGIAIIASFLTPYFGGRRKHVHLIINHVPMYKSAVFYLGAATLSIFSAIFIRGTSRYLPAGSPP